MDRFFQFDNGFMRAMSKLYDIIFLSVLWIVFSIPIVTIGASTTALYYTAVKVILHERDYVFSSFWKAFKDNFLNATIFWLILLVVYVSLGTNIWMAFPMFGEDIGVMMQGVYIFLMLLLSFMSVYIFPVQSRFVMNKMQILKLCLFMGMKHLPYSVIMVLIGAIAIIGVYLITPLILVMPVAATLFISVFMERVLKKYMPKENDENLDQWYLE